MEDYAGLIERLFYNGRAYGDEDKTAAASAITTLTQTGCIECGRPEGEAHKDFCHKKNFVDGMCVIKSQTADLATQLEFSRQVIRSITGADDEKLQKYVAALARAKAAEAKVDALMREKEELREALQNVRSAVEWGVVLAWITHGAVACANTKENGIQAARKVRIAVWAIDDVLAIRALVREQNTSKEDKPNMEDSSVARSTNHPSIEGG